MTHRYGAQALILFGLATGVAGYVCGAIVAVDGKIPPVVIVQQAARLKGPMCDTTDPKNRIAVLVQEAAKHPEQWHRSTDTSDWLENKQANLMLYRNTFGTIQVGRATQSLMKAREPDIDPACRYLIRHTMQQLSDSMDEADPVEGDDL